MNKCIFISHELNFMKEPEENSIILKGFYGDETDKEFIKLEKELKKLLLLKDLYLLFIFQMTIHCFSLLIFFRISLMLFLISLISFFSNFLNSFSNLINSLSVSSP